MSWQKLVGSAANVRLLTLARTGMRQTAIPAFRPVVLSRRGIRRRNGSFSTNMVGEVDILTWRCSPSCRSYISRAGARLLHWIITGLRSIHAGRRPSPYANGKTSPSIRLQPQNLDYVMCYSAQVNQRLKTLRRRHNARRDDPAFEKLFRDRLTNDRILIPILVCRGD